ALYLGRRRDFETNPSEESVHELRVATRKLMAQLDLFTAVVPGRSAEKGRRALKRTMKTLGALRDLQVQRLFLEQHLRPCPELILVRDHLEKQEQSLRAVAAVEVCGVKIRKFEKWIALMFQELAEKMDRARNRERLPLEVARILDKAYAAVVRRRREIRTH